MLRFGGKLSHGGPLNVLLGIFASINLIPFRGDVRIQIFGLPTHRISKFLGCTPPVEAQYGVYRSS